MKLEDAENLALVTMEDHGIGNTWTFAFDGAKRRCGQANFKLKRITLSRHFVQRNGESEVRDTVLHEVAHALAGSAAGHGPRWQMWAIRVGARPQRCASNVDMPEGGIEGVCAPDCTVRHTRHRMPPKRLLDAYQCNHCYSKVTWVVVK